MADMWRIYMRWKTRQHILSRVFGLVFPAFVLLALALWLYFPLITVSAATLTPALPASAGCAQLAHADPTATNGAAWGATLLPGLGAPGGWFGVPVCANSMNQVAPGGANLSCDRIPRDFPASGCAPGAPTSDGYGWSFQCVELVIRFSAWAFGAYGGWHGDAPYLWLSWHHPASFSAFANGGTRAPMPGDVLVWGTLDHKGNPWPAGPAGGHVAVVAAVGNGWITFVEENMLGRHGNIPEETTKLTESGGHWTIGPTYATSGGRALYGWLHSSSNTGQFPGSAAPTTQLATPTVQPAASSLAQGVIVTGAGALTQLVWSDTHTPERPMKAGKASVTTKTTPHTLVESLGAPPGVMLAPDQTPAVVTLPNGERYSFARGDDGQLYAAYTTPNMPGALWQALGAPPGATLTSEVTAQWDGVSVIVGALGSDGALWIRSGPAGMLDGWVSLGRPERTTFQGAPALNRAPGSPAYSAGSPANAAENVGWVALAIGRDGALYEADWRANAAASSATPATGPTSPHAPGWSDWAPVTAIEGAAQLTGAPLVISEPLSATKPHLASAAPAIGSVDTLATDVTGRLWLLRRASMAQPWQAHAISLPNARATLLGVMITPPTAKSRSSGGGAATLQVYLSSPLSNASASFTTTNKHPVNPGASQSGSNGADQPVNHPAVSPTNQRIFAGALPLNLASASSTTRWQALAVTQTPALSAAPEVAGKPVALSLDSSLGALVVAQGPRVTLIGDETALRLLAPQGSWTQFISASASAGRDATSAAPAPAASGIGSVVLGTVSPPSGFSDSFTGLTLDPHWTVLGAPSSAAQVTQSALNISAPTTSDYVEVAQGAPTTPFTATVRVTPGASWRAGAQVSGQTGSQAGVLLTLDDGNMLSLSLRADGTVALCPVASGKALPCETVTAPVAANANQGLSLRVSQSGADVTGAVSADGTNWTQVGVWSLAWLPSMTSFVGAYAPPLGAFNAPDPGTPSISFVTPVAFTRLGLFVASGKSQGARGQTGTPARFSAFVVTSPEGLVG